MQSIQLLRLLNSVEILEHLIYVGLQFYFPTPAIRLSINHQSVEHMGNSI
jgi:hypothetical protein